MRRQLRALNRPKPQFAFTMRDDGDVKYAPGQRFQKVWMFKNTGNFESFDFASPS